MGTIRGLRSPRYVLGLSTMIDRRRVSNRRDRLTLIERERPPMTTAADPESASPRRREAQTQPGRTQRPRRPGPDPTDTVEHRGRGIGQGGWSRTIWV